MSKRSDKLFQKNKAKTAKAVKRKEAFLKERRRVLVVCEGEKTEPNYIKAFARTLGLTTTEVKICSECDSAPISVVNFGEKKFNEDPDFDMVFFVFDQDDHESYSRALNKICDLVKRDRFVDRIVAAITSVPCFEIWFLLHFELHSKPYRKSGNLIKTLKTKDGFNEYKKGDENHFDLLRERIDVAKINSKKRLQQSEDAGDRLHYGNPTTQMHILIEHLEDVASDSNRPVNHLPTA